MKEFIYEIRHSRRGNRAATSMGFGTSPEDAKKRFEAKTGHLVDSVKQYRGNRRREG